MTKPPKYDSACKGCGAHVPSGTPQHHIVGAGPTCEACGKRSRENWLAYKRRGAEHNRRQRENEQLQRDAFTSEGGLLGALYECAQCGEDYLLDRPHFHTHPTTQHLCETCEHIYWTVNEYQYNLRVNHGQSRVGSQQRARRGLGYELQRSRRAVEPR